jgi:hypothetical protein
MIRAFGSSLVVGAVVLAVSVGVTHAQTEEHGRKWKPLPPMAHIVVTVEKAFNGKPIPNAGVVFHAVRNGKNDGNLEVKTDPDGRATIDVIEEGSQVSVQVIASGFETSAQQFDATGPNEELLFKMQRPRAQVSTYTNNDGKPEQITPGVQEHTPQKPAPDGQTK